jgi:hypothetical protein
MGSSGRSSARLRNIAVLLASQYVDTNLKRRMKSSYRIHADRQKPRSKYCSKTGTPWNAKQISEHQRI